MIYVSGVVSNDPQKLGYLKYLGHRFNELKERQVGEEWMRPQLIWIHYRRFVGYNVAETPLESFENASRYLQGPHYKFEGRSNSMCKREECLLNIR